MIHNPYWDELEKFVPDEVDPTWQTRTVGGSSRSPAVDAWTLREAMVRKYSWTITSPDAIGFIVAHTRGNLIDPMAGTGYWSYLLTQAGVDCVSSDRHPPAADLDDNMWHPHMTQHVEVKRQDAVQAAHQADPRRTLLLAWPPVDNVASLALQAFGGERMIYIGEGQGGCTADDGFFDVIDKDWHLTAFHPPVQYDGIHDYITVYDRN